MSSRPTDKRSAILQAALESFAENGFHASPTSIIAKKANVGTGTIYRYFESKDDLIEALFQETEPPLREAMVQGYDEQAPLREGFLCLLSNSMRFFLEHPCEFKFLEQYFNSPYGVEKKREDATGCERPMISLFKRGIERQVIKDLPEEILFSLSFGPVVFLVRDHLHGYYKLTEDMLENALEACWDAIKQ